MGLHLPSVLLYTSNPSTWGMEGGKSEIWGHPWLCSRSEVSLDLVLKTEVETIKQNFE